MRELKWNTVRPEFADAMTNYVMIPAAIIIFLAEMLL